MDSGSCFSVSTKESSSMIVVDATPTKWECGDRDNSSASETYEPFDKVEI